MPSSDDLVLGNIEQMNIIGADDLNFILLVLMAAVVPAIVSAAVTKLMFWLTRERRHKGLQKELDKIWGKP